MAAMGIAENILHIKSCLPEGVRLVVVSKTRSPEEIMEAYHAGHRSFGENRGPEINEKAPSLPHDIEWHFIGHLQTNKVHLVVPHVDLIHSVDSLHLMMEINKEAAGLNRMISCLLQLRISKDEAKYGFTEENCFTTLDSGVLQKMKNIKIIGIMGMASLSTDKSLIRSEFKNLKRIFYDMKSRFFLNDDAFCEISMGMSDDYQIALEEGSTMLRIGSAIFGENVRKML